MQSRGSKQALSGDSQALPALRRPCPSLTKEDMEGEETLSALKPQSGGQTGSLHPGVTAAVPFIHALEKAAWLWVPPRLRHAGGVSPAPRRTPGEVKTPPQFLQAHLFRPQGSSSDRVSGKSSVVASRGLSGCTAGAPGQAGWSGRGSALRCSVLTGWVGLGQTVSETQGLLPQSPLQRLTTGFRVSRIAAPSLDSRPPHPKGAPVPGSVDIADISTCCHPWLWPT